MDVRIAKDALLGQTAVQEMIARARRLNAEKTGRLGMSASFHLNPQAKLCTLFLEQPDSGNNVGLTPLVKGCKKQDCAVLFVIAVAVEDEGR